MILSPRRGLLTAPRGLAHVVAFFGRSITTVQGVLDKDRSVFRVGNERERLELWRTSGAIILSRLVLGPGTDILHLDGTPHLRLTKATLPDTYLAAASGQPLQSIIETPALPIDEAIKVTAAVPTLSGDVLFRIYWPQDPFVI